MLALLPLVNPDWDTPQLASGLQNASQRLDEDLSDLPDDEYFRQSALNDLRAAGDQIGPLALQAGWGLTILAVALVIYRTHPNRIRRRKALRPYTSESDPEVDRELRQLATLTGIRSIPTLELEQDFRVQDAQVFGFSRKYSLRLGAGLRLVLRRARDGFRAVVMHEFAHIANRDVGRAYFSQAMWTSALLLIVLPTVVLLGGLLLYDVARIAIGAGVESPDWNRIVTVRLPSLLVVAIQVSVTLAAVAIIRAGLLRVREIYADWRAAIWGAGASLTNLLQGLVGRGDESRLFRFLRLHPSPSDRLSALQEPAKLFRVSHDLPFLVGFFIAIVAASVMLPLALVATSVGSATSALGALIFGSYLISPDPSTVGLVSSVSTVFFILAVPLAFGLFAIPVVGMGYLATSLGTQVQREAVADLVVLDRSSRANLRLLVYAGIMVLGLEMGFLLQPFSVVWPSNLTAVLRIAAIMIGLVGLSWLSLVYLRYLSQRILGAHVGRRPPNWSRRLLTLIFAVLMGAVLVPVMIGRVFGVTVIDEAADEFLGPIVFGSLIAWVIIYILAILMGWLYVQTTGLFRRRRCPSCSEVTRQRYGVGQACETCGNELSPWIFVDAVSTAASEPKARSS